MSDAVSQGKGCCPHKLINAINKSPDYISPVRTVPQTADSTDNQQVAVFVEDSLTASAQGNIEIIFKPFIKRNMPSAPKLGNTSGKIGGLKVIRHPEAEYHTSSKGDCGITGKVAVYLESKKNCRCKKEGTGGCGKAAVYIVHQQSGSVSNHKL